MVLGVRVLRCLPGMELNMDGRNSLYSSAYICTGGSKASSAPPPHFTDQNLLYIFVRLGESQACICL